MSKKKLSGLKVIREYFNITPSQLATKLMLLNEVNITRVLQGQDIIDMESLNIVDDNDVILDGLECIFKLPKACYTNVKTAQSALDNLKRVETQTRDIFDDFESITGLTIKAKDLNNNQYTDVIYLPKDISKEAINKVYHMFIINRKPVKDKKEFDELLLQMKTELFKYSKFDINYFYDNFNSAHYDIGNRFTDDESEQYKRSIDIIRQYIKDADFIYNEIIKYGICDFKKLSIIFPYVCDKYIQELEDFDNSLGDDNDIN